MSLVQQSSRLGKLVIISLNLFFFFNVGCTNYSVNLINGPTNVRRKDMTITERPEAHEMADCLNTPNQEVHLWKEVDWPDTLFLIWGSSIISSVFGLELIISYSFLS